MLLGAISSTQSMWGLLLLYCLTPSVVLGQYSWEQSRSEELPARLWHSSLCLEDSVVTYGGYNNVENEALSDLLSYDPEEQQWHPISSTGGPHGGRYGHTASLLHDKMLIVGGENTTSFLHEVWTLDLGTFLFSTDLHLLMSLSSFPRVAKAGRSPLPPVRPQRRCHG